MFTLVAYSEEADTGGILKYLSALPDQHIRVEGNNIVVPAGMNNLLAAFALGANVVLAQVESPALRRTVLLDIPFLNRSAIPGTTISFFDAFYNPISLDEYEPMRFLSSEDGTGATRMTGLVWLGDGAQSPISGEIYTVRATSTVTLSPYSWTNAALSFTQVLPAGRYAVVGMSAMSASLLAARLVFVGGTWRPGVIGRTSLVMPRPDVFSRGALGVWGEFTHDQPPTIDFLATGADTSQIVFLDLVKIA